MEQAIMSDLYNIKTILLLPDKLCLVDADIYPELIGYNWYYGCGGYAVCSRQVSGKKKTIYMHRQIMNAKKGIEVDHINRDKLDNRTDNLRLCRRKGNARNLPKRLKDGKAMSLYKGVTWRKDRQKWCARIVVDYKTISLGVFMKEIDAALAYNEAAKKYFGKYANLNVL
jgi:hypothetical protein